MKKNILILLIGIIMGGIVFGSIVYAYSYTAKQVGFTPNDKSWKVNNVSDAIEYLYGKNNKSLSFVVGAENYGSNVKSASVIHLAEFKTNYKYFKLTESAKSSSDKTISIRGEYTDWSGYDNLSLGTKYNVSDYVAIYFYNTTNGWYNALVTFYN